MPIDIGRRALILAVSMTAAGWCVAGCSRDAGSESRPVKMRIGVGVPPVPTAGSGLKFTVSALTQDSWMTSQADGRLGPRIASAWSWNADRTQLRLTIRNDIYFHDGTLLTPEIAAAAIRASVNDEEYVSFSSVRSVEVNGSDGVLLTLSSPNSFVLTDLAMVSLHKPGTKQVISTGPFKPVAAETTGQTVLHSFEKYYLGRPALDEIDIFTYKTQRSAWTALMRGEIDMLQEVSRDAAGFVAAESAIRSYSFPRSYYISLVFNIRHPILKNIEVRRAINEAVDKQVLIREGMRGKGRPADSPIWPEHWAYVAGEQAFAFNPAGARARLEAAGFPIRPGVDGKMPSRLSFTCLVFGDDSRFEHLELLLQRQLADVGIDLKLVPVPLVELGPKLKAGDFDAFVFEMAGRSLSWTYEFWHSRTDGKGFINTGYTSTDAVLEQIRAAKSDDETRAGIATLAKILHDDPPAAFLAWQEQSRAVSTAFDVATEANRDPLPNVWQWRPAASPIRQASR